MYRIIKILVPAALLCAGMLCSCQKDEISTAGSESADWVTKNIAGKTFTDESGLTLTYSGAPMYGKTAVVTACTPGSITIRLNGAPMDVPLIGRPTGTPGVFPGESQTEFVLPYALNGDTVEISTVVERSNYSCTFDAALTSGAFDIRISDVVVAGSEALAGKTFPLVNPGEDVEQPSSDSPVEELDTFFPYHLYWAPEDASVEIDLGFFKLPMPLKSIFMIMLNMEMIDTPDGSKVSVSDALKASIKDVTFHADGNITASFCKDFSGEAAESPLNLAQYKVTGDGKIMLYLNAAGIAFIENSVKSRAADGVDFAYYFNTIINAYLPMLQSGIELGYRTTEQGITTFFVDQKFVGTAFQLLAELLGNDAVVTMLMDLLKDNETAASFLPMLEGIIPQLPGLIKGCTGFELGINFTAPVEAE